jgi:hypothetical protein
MRIREAIPEDFERLKEISLPGFPVPDLSSPSILGVQVVTDESGEILLGAAAQRTAEIFLFCPPGCLHPAVKMEGIRLLHGGIRDTIVPKGYSEGFSFVEPHVERAFGRHLIRRFGWEKTWPAYRILDWKGEPHAEGR